MKKNNYFKYVVFGVVLLIPFIYSFFYLKAYWDPYGSGNIDNLPVAIVNLDTGDKGEEIIDSIKDSGKLKLIEVDAKDAEEGLYNTDYYAIITIPDDFTDSMESASSTSKKHAMITYSPNQKSNYLASQIINNVVLQVEKKLDNTVNSNIVSNLSDSLESVPDNLNTISNGFSELNDGTNKLVDGSSSLKEGTNNLKNGTSSLAKGSTNLKSGSLEIVNGVSDLKSNYYLFNNGLKDLNDGVTKLNEATSQLDSINSSLVELGNGVSSLKNGSDQLLAINSYIDGTNQVLSTIEGATSLCSEITTVKEQQLCGILYGITSSDDVKKMMASSDSLKEGNSNLNAGLGELNNKVQGLSSVSSKMSILQSSVKELSNGTQELYNNSLKIQMGINSLNDGVSKLNNGINSLDTGINTLNNGAITLDSGVSSLDSGLVTLNSSVELAKKELDDKIKTTETELEKVSGLDEYANEPVNLETSAVNEVSSYGTAFSPFFISIALWVGCLMMYIVLYYDKDERFGILGINSKNRLQRTLCYQGIATVSSIILGILLWLFLDFSITNIWLYFISLILIANTFMGIIQFLILNFSDVGKFIALILLVLQLASSGGTFPIETVTKGFRWMNNILPMKYTINLLREALVVIEKDLLVKNIIVVIIICFGFLIFNVINDVVRVKKENN